MMSVPLAEALSQVELEEGRTYQCEVKGRRVVVRVLKELPRSMLPAPIVESDIMLDPWFELPTPKGGKIIVAKLGPPPRPDIPIIPAEDEYE
jgi:hypothetical protein